MSVNDTLKRLGIEITTPTPPVGVFVPAGRVGDLWFLSGHIATRGDGPWRGRLGGDITTGQGQEAARAATIDMLGTLQATVGDLDKVAKIVKLTVLVNSEPHFIEQHLVANGASELLVEVFGAAIGAHARTAFGVAQIPLGACVEIDIVVKTR
jgi:enamine deaminase RidA (YjgF/YER057c/UK114 family)